MTDQPKLRWGILSTGHIAQVFAEALPHSRTGTLVAVASRGADQAQAFAKKHGDHVKAYACYEDLLADEEVEAVYIATPHPFHEAGVLACAEAGKHILCEKPLGMNASQAQRMIAVAEKADVFLMEAFMYRFTAQMKRILEVVRSGELGRIRVLEASFSFDGGDRPTGRLLNQALGGGGILDVGCYPMSIVRLLAGAAMGKDRSVEPIQLKGLAHIGETGVDETASALLLFPGKIEARITCGVRLFQEKHLIIYGEKGRLRVPSPWNPGREGGTSFLYLAQAGSADEEIIEVSSNDWAYALEADAVAEYLDRRQPSYPAVDWEESILNLKALDWWRAEVGLSYAQDDL